MVELCKSGMLDNGSLVDWRGSLGSGWSARSARSERYGFRTVHTLIQDISVIWRGQFVDNTNIKLIYLLTWNRRFCTSCFISWDRIMIAKCRGDRDPCQIRLASQVVDWFSSLKQIPNALYHLSAFFLRFLCGRGLVSHGERWEWETFEQSTSSCAESVTCNCNRDYHTRSSIFVTFHLQYKILISLYFQCVQVQWVLITFHFNVRPRALWIYGTIDV